MAHLRPKTIEDLKQAKAIAKEKIAAVKKAAKPKKRPKKDRHKKFSAGGEEQWQGSIAYPKEIIMKDGRKRYETYQLDNGCWSFSPKPDGNISLYGARANSLFGWDAPSGRVTILQDSVEVWWYDAQGVHSGLSGDPQAINARQRWEAIRRTPQDA